MKITLITAGIENYTGFCDQDGTRIFIKSRLEFYERDGCIWQGNVIFEDGMVTIDILRASQVKNPDGWKQTHDWIKSRWWSGKVGLSETGTWNCSRISLPRIAGNFKTSEEFFAVKEKYLKVNNVEYAHESLERPLPCRVVG